jgi:hypothetical protein
LNIGGADGWKSTFAITSDSLTAWIAANSSAGTLHAWWEKARDVSEAADAWWTEYSTGSNYQKFTAGNVGPEAAVSCTDGAGTTVTTCMCDVATTPTGGTWTKTADNTEADCKTACENYTITGLLEVDSNVNGTGFDNLGTTLTPSSNGKFAKFSATGQWCGAYSFLSTGTADAANANPKC